MKQISLLYTGNQQVYSVRYSPFDNSLLACVTCDKFGISGDSSLMIIQYQENFFLDSKFFIVELFRSSNAMFDVDWNPVDKSLLATAGGDGSIAIWKWDIENNKERKPQFIQKRHEKEVYSVQWEPSGMRSYHLMSASWDQTINIWNLSSSGLTALTSLKGHDSIVYSGCWNPKMSGVLLSTSADKKFSLWDVNSSSINSASIFKSLPFSSDILCCDWNKFNPNIFVLGYASGLIEIRDFRNLKEPCLKSIGLAHDYAIRKIKFSPTLEKLIGSVSYDMTTKLWNAESCRLVEVSKNHSEFAYSLDFDPKIQNRLVDAGWDNRVIISEFEIDSNFF